MSEKSEVEAVVDVVTDMFKAELVEITSPDGTKAMIATRPNGERGIAFESVKKFFDEYRTSPEFRHGVARFEDLASFIAHTVRFKDVDSAMFASTSATCPSLTSVLDYHPAEDRASPPRFCKHRGVYSFPLSEEWQAWSAQNGKPMQQVDFAAFLEDRVLDLTDEGAALDRAREFAAALDCKFASPTKLIELSRGLAMRVDAKVKQALNLSSGEAQIQYETTHTDETGAPLKVPTAFLVTMPVFRNGAAYQIPARLRYRHRDGRITWSYELYRIDRVLDHAVREACSQAATETGLPLFYGSPET